jgi:hypothetical protein
MRFYTGKRKEPDPPPDPEMGERAAAMFGLFLLIAVLFALAKRKDRNA